TLVPNDITPRAAESGDIAVPDITGRSLFLLMSAVNTDNLTVVLDSCHSGGGVRGNLRTRAVERLGNAGQRFVASPAELEYQAQWRSRLGLSLAAFNQARQSGIAKGVALGSALANQYAADAAFADFHAGAFTYLLTRYLWQQPNSQSLGSVFVNLTRSTQDVAQASGVVQQPVYQVMPTRNYSEAPVYFIDQPTAAAEAVIRQIEGDQVEFWLGGVSSESLEAFSEGAVFNVIDRDGRTLGTVTQTSRVGLVGYGTLTTEHRAVVSTGALLRERIRGVPTDLALRVGLDPSLGRDLAAAQSALQSVTRIVPVPVDQQTPVDYLLGRMSEAVLAESRTLNLPNLTPIGSIGLFTAGLRPLPDSFGRVDEPIAAAVNRLRSPLKMLLAGRLLRLVLNRDSSTLRVSVSVMPVSDRSAATPVSSRGAEEAGIVPQQIATASNFRPGTEIQVQVQNNESRNLYIGVLAIASSGEIIILYPVEWDAPIDAALVARGQTLTVPPRSSTPEDDFRFVVQGPSGTLSLLVLASTEPLRDALRGLQQIARSRGVRSGDPIALSEDEPITVIESLLGDFDQSTRAGIAVSRGIRAVDTTQLAAIATTIEVVE
ncbi:MAG TPA: DUF4384 domain-containing protein, partial [Chroococcidiopsis sp.]